MTPRQMLEECARKAAVDTCYQTNKEGRYKYILKAFEPIQEMIEQEHLNWQSAIVSADVHAQERDTALARAEAAERERDEADLELRQLEDAYELRCRDYGIAVQQLDALRAQQPPHA